MGIFNELYYTVQAKAGICTPNVRQLAQELEQATKYARYAQTAATGFRFVPGAPAALQTAADALAKLSADLRKANKMAGDIGAACQISDAVAKLNRWAHDPAGDNREAAAAFDQLFGGAARFAAKLPFGLGAYAKVLEQISISGFFSSMQRLGASRAGENGSTPTGRALQEVEAELRRQSGR